MTVTLTANYRETLAPETVALIDGFVESQYDLGCMLEFIDENSEEDFREYYDDYVELGEEFGYEAVDAFIELNDLSDLKDFERAFIGVYSSAAYMAEEFLESEVDRLSWMIVVDWEATAKYLIDDGDIECKDDYYFRRHY